MATRITVELSDDELRALEPLRAGIPRVARAAAEREAGAEAYRNAYHAQSQEGELGEAGAELFARIVEEESGSTV